MIDVSKQTDGRYQVSVTGSRPTRHQVNLSDEYYRNLTGGKVPAEKLIEASFEFLLEREPNTSILSEFDLPVIERYFPEYEDEIRKRLASS